jgi:hypothetical protein
VTARQRWLGIAALALVLALGWLSNAITTQRCLSATRGEVAAELESLRSTLGGYSLYADLAKRPISWATARELRDASAEFYGWRSWYLGPHFLPNAPRIQTPWGYAVLLSQRIPFVVSVAYGYDFNGQAGATGVHYYFSFFGVSTRLRDRVIGLF